MRKLKLIHCKEKYLMIKKSWKSNECHAGLEYFIDEVVHIKILQSQVKLIGQLLKQKIFLTTIGKK